MVPGLLRTVAILSALVGAALPFNVYFHQANHMQNKPRYIIQNDLIMEGFRVPRRSLAEQHNVRDSFISFAPDKDAKG